MTLFTVDTEKCARDGICEQECPTRIIEFRSKEDFPKPIKEAEQFCIACGHCVAVCPHEAISLKWLKPEDCRSINQEWAFTAQQAEQFLKSRRSIRTFKHKAVEKEKLEKLLEVACYAPSAKNMQPWHWTIVRDGEEVRRLAGMVIDWMRGIVEKSRDLAEAMGFLRVLEAWDMGYERICRGAPHVIVAHADKNWPFGAEDCTLALDYLELFATATGLGTCWGGYFYAAVNQHPPLFEALGLPAEHKAYGAMMVGYPKFTYPRVPKRNLPKISWK